MILFGILLFFGLICCNCDHVNNFQYGWKYPCAAGSVASKLPFCNTSLSFEDRAKDLIYNQLNVSELIDITGNGAGSISRLGIPGYQWWNEALHGVANCEGVTYNGPINSTTMFPQIIGTAASWNRTLWHKIGQVVSTEARAMINNQQAGFTYWAPNVNIFRYFVSIFFYRSQHFFHVFSSTSFVQGYCKSFWFW